MKTFTESEIEDIVVKCRKLVNLWDLCVVNPYLPTNKFTAADLHNLNLYIHNIVHATEDSGTEHENFITEPVKVE